MMPRKLIVRRDPSAIATCPHVLAYGSCSVFRCRAPMEIVIKESKCWSYQERVSERCAAGHIAHAQAVVVESEIEEGC